MRYELTDHEWTAIRPFLPNKPRGVPRVNDRRVLNGIFWVLRSEAPWRDLSDNFGPYPLPQPLRRWRQRSVHTCPLGLAGAGNAWRRCHDERLELVQVPLAVDRRREISRRTGFEREPVRDENRTVQRRCR